MAGTQRGLAAAFRLQPCQRELYVFASAERVGREIGTRAMIVAGLHTANLDVIGPLTLRIGDVELREKRLVADILECEFLLAPELSPELDLPIFQRHLGRLVQARQLGFLFAFAPGVSLPRGSTRCLSLHDGRLPCQRPASGRASMLAVILGKSGGELPLPAVTDRSGSGGNFSYPARSGRGDRRVESTAHLAAAAIAAEGTSSAIAANNSCA